MSQLKVSDPFMISDVTLTNAHVVKVLDEETCDQAFFFFLQKGKRNLKGRIGRV